MTLETPRAARLAAGVAVGALAAATPAYAQLGMSATSLSGGFMPSPQVFALTARGADLADRDVSGCPGYVDLDGSGFRIALTDGFAPLRFYLDSLEGPGLLLRGPDGISRCAPVDDNGIASVAMGAVQNGDYHIWPLSPEPDVSVDTRLLVSEYELQDWEIRPPEPPDPDNLEPPILAGVSIDLDAGGRQELAAGSITGSFPASDLEPGCSGNIDPEAAHVTADLSQPVDELSFNIEARRDAVMMVLTPDGVWLCNDDARGRDPAVTAAPAPEGRYYILGGTFGQDITIDATFFASLSSPIWSDGQVGYDYEREFGGWDDEGDAHTDTGTLAIGDEAAFDWILLPEEGAPPVSAPFPLTGTEAASNFQPHCWGQIDPSRPDFVIEVGDDGDPLALRVRSNADTTRLVVSPSGEIDCNDDTYGLDPEIAYPAADAGEYDVWVGSWGSGDGRSATLTVSRAPRRRYGRYVLDRHRS